MKFRKIISLTALVSFIVLFLTGVVLFIQPHGRVAYWVDWRLAGLSKSQWDSIHIHAGILFFVTIVFHIYFNWRAVVSYLKGRFGHVRVLNVYSGVALLITAVVVAGTIAEKPPFCWVMRLNESIKQSAAETYGKPPYGHAELSSLETLALRMGLDLTRAMQALAAAGIKVESQKQRLVDIAELNRKTPGQVYTVMVAAQETP